jgi:putative cardiolipin synthase
MGLGLAYAAAERIHLPGIAATYDFDATIMKTISMRRRSFLRRSPLVYMCVIGILLSGCASIDLDYPKQTSTAVLETGDTQLGQQISPLVANYPGESGFLLLSDGIDALATRLLMAQLAEQTLDAQYYLITNDDIGHIFIGALLEAADRGVRVRLLLDDIQTQGYDAGMGALDSHPNFEVRIFNPFGARSARAANIMHYRRVNRRMHNKSITADNQVTIVGGRNIAAEYFAYRNDVNFTDVDVLAAGPVVQDVSTMFDTYWNSRYAAPMQALGAIPDDPGKDLQSLRERIREAWVAAKQTPYRDAFSESWDTYVAETGESFEWAPYELVYDSPDKADSALAKQAESIVTSLKRAVNSATLELTIVSPYFVPLNSGIEYLAELQSRGVQVNVITNSFAANNHAVVHSGYSPARIPLLRAGVRIFEVRADATVAGVDRGGSGASLSTLHTKSFLVDRKRLFIGSFNWDPRSAYINTELGVIIDSAELGELAGRKIDLALDEKAYEVLLDDRGQLRWVDRSGAEEISFHSEPDMTWWDRFTVGLMRILPIKGQL